jgi:cysteine sulfinate desulfinase/cysteine desulfurase-like protein
MGLEPRVIDSTLRISISRLTTFEEIDDTLAVLGEIVPSLQRVARRV